jgi:RecB family exonuclease
MQKQLSVLPSSRSIRQRILASKNSNAFLDPCITVGEFLNRLLYIPDLIHIDNDRRNLLLLEASEFKNFSALKIERNFFTFTQNSSYIFRFLEELSGEEVSIDTIEMSDTYGDYEEHLNVLHELYKRYESIAYREGVIDPIFLKKSYTLNTEYLTRFDKVLFVLEGYLTNFEFHLLLSCAKITLLELEYHSTRYNNKMSEKLRALGFDIQEGYHYVLNLTEMSVGEKTPTQSNHRITCKQFVQRLEQVAFIKEQVYLMHKEGIDLDQIVVIVPDESFAQQIRLFDQESNFNFAMGRAFSETALYEKLQATLQLLDATTIENSARVNRLGAELFELLRTCYHEGYAPKHFDDFITLWRHNEEDQRINALIDQELYRFESLQTHLAALSMKQVLHLFLQRIRVLSIDDVGGGKITVMGLLESRGVRFEGVIIVDFNEGYVPRSSEKDLFLNSGIRKKSGLPTQKDREALQKHYYHLLITRAKNVAISYVESDDAIPSRFLTQLGIEKGETAQSDAYAALIFNKGLEPKLTCKEIVAPFDFTSMQLSATGLKSFLTCKRQFYYRYVAKIKNHEIPKELPQEWEIGNLLHETLNRVYTQNSRFDTLEALEYAMDASFEAMHESNPLIRYQIKLWKKRLHDFYDNEMRRFEQGYVVERCEESLTCKHQGLTLYGKIDRIDRCDNRLEVLDYKSGSYTLYNAKNVEDATDFQLEFYYLLASTLGEVSGCGYYDLKSGLVVPEAFMQEKLQLLASHLETIQMTKTFNFERCEDHLTCTYCEYAIICLRMS